MLIWSKARKRIDTEIAYEVQENVNFRSRSLDQNKLSRGKRLARVPETSTENAGLPRAVHVHAIYRNSFKLD